MKQPIPAYPDCELGDEAARPCEALLIDIARWRARSFVAARRNSCNRPSKTQVSEKAPFAAGERDAATRIFNINQNANRGRNSPVPSKSSKPKNAYSISTIYTAKFFTDDHCDACLFLRLAATSHGL
ncbi:MAG: hypothetical protein Q7T29_09610 [Gallionella sp.]|nr:hypothetical protein [Gallionella sp.]